MSLALSKKHGRAKKRRKHHPPVACPSCLKPADSSPGALLRSLERTLNACADAGLKVRFAHGAVLTEEGYVLPWRIGKQSGWTARTLAYDPLAPEPDPDAIADEA